jgi:preprotein translocase subunit SecY
MRRKKKNKNVLFKRVFSTLLLVTLSRLGAFVPVPGIDHEAFYQTISSNPIVNFLNIFSGGGFALIGLFALGIVPFINASILIQLGTSLIPSLEKLQKEEGELGRQKLTQITRYTSLVWSALQSLGIALWVKPYVFDWNVRFIAETTLALTTGSMLVMWIAEQITERGIGNGASILIFVNILSGLPKLIQQRQSGNLFELLILTLIFLGIVIGIIFVQEGTRKIPIVSARQLWKGQTETKTSYLPLRLNQGGVMPIIFASTFIILPAYVSQVTSNSTVIYLANLLTPNGSNKIIYLLFYFSLILFFSYFYASLILNPTDMAKNLRKLESSIPGVRPGKATSDYLQKTLNRLTFLGALFLALLAIIPTIIENIASISTFKGLGATSLLILVGVAIDTSKQIQTYIITKKYEEIMN